MDPLDDKLLRTNAVANRYGVDRTTIARWVKLGRFPKPLKIGPNAVAWRLSDLLVWEAEREGGAAA